MELFDEMAAYRHDRYLKAIRRMRRHEVKRFVVELRAPTPRLVVPSDQSLWIFRVHAADRSWDDGRLADADELHICTADRCETSLPIRFLASAGHRGVDVDVVVTPRSEFFFLTKKRHELCTDAHPPPQYWPRLGEEDGGPVDLYVSCYLSRDVA